jgi:AcrR family transcriptional regulator
MEEQSKVRIPKQKRSIDKKDKILAAAYQLFCEAGYYKTTTPEVAKKGGVSIGCLYSYFADKNDLFMAVLDRYDGQFDALRLEALRSLDDRDIPLKDSFRRLLGELVAIHKASKALNAEMKLLYHSDAAIAARMDARDAKIRAAILSSIKANKKRLRVKDLEAAAEIAADITGAIVDRIVFGKAALDGDRILNAGVEALCVYLEIK